MMKLIFQCVRCKEVLGVYEGKDFWVVSERVRSGQWQKSDAWFSNYILKILCCGCWNETKGEVEAK